MTSAHVASHAIAMLYGACARLHSARLPETVPLRHSETFCKEPRRLAMVMTPQVHLVRCAHANLGLAVQANRRAPSLAARHIQAIPRKISSYWHLCVFVILRCHLITWSASSVSKDALIRSSMLLLPMWHCDIVFNLQQVQ